jgi:hypothetical protein
MLAKRSSFRADRHDTPLVMRLPSFSMGTRKGSDNREVVCMRVVGVTTMTIDELLNAITAKLTAIGAATDVGSIGEDGDRVSTILTIEDRRVRLSLEPARENTDELAA